MHRHLWWANMAVSALVSAALAACSSHPADPAAAQPSQAGVATVQAAVQSSCHPEPLTGAAAMLGPFSHINPKQAMTAQALNARVCWGGGLRTLKAISQERDCMVLLQFESSEKAGVSWPQENRFFKACGRGPYDRQLLGQFTLVWVSGKVTGQAEFAGTPIPVIEIDALYRGSDCLEGDTSPQCVHDYLQPLKKPQ